MKYRITLNDEDYVRFRIFNIYHSKLGKRQIKKARTVSIKLSAIFIALLLISDVHLDLIEIFVISSAIVSVFYYFYAPKRLEKNTRRQIGIMKEDGKLPYNADAEIEFLESVIVHKSEHGEFHVNYRDIERFYIEQEYLYIYYNAVQAFMIPYRCLGEDKGRVIEYIMSKRSGTNSI